MRWIVVIGLALAGAACSQEQGPADKVAEAAEKIVAPTPEPEPLAEGKWAPKDTCIDVEGAAGRMGDTLSDNAATKIEAFKRGALQGLTDFFGNTVIPGVEELVEVFQEDGLGGVIDRVGEMWSDAWPGIEDRLGEMASGLWEWIQDAARFLPSNAGQLLMGTGGGSNPLEPWAASLTLVVWVVAGLVGASAVLKSRDA